MGISHEICVAIFYFLFYTPLVVVADPETIVVVVGHLLFIVPVFRAVTALYHLTDLKTTRTTDL